jgi:hypothetical protein
MNRRIAQTAATLTVLALLGLTAGCSSDAVAPQDEIPPVTVKGAATQAGFIAAAVSQATQIFVRDIGPAKDVVEEPIGGQGGVTGSVFIDYRAGADGPPSTPREATWAYMYTAEGAPLSYTNPVGGGVTTCALGVMADLDRYADSAKVLQGSGGVLTSGENVVEFAMTGTITGSVSYPTDGLLDVTSADHFAQVTFNGTNMVTMIVDHARTFLVNLDTGEVTEVMP